MSTQPDTESDTSDTESVRHGPDFHTICTDVELSAGCQCPDWWRTEIPVQEAHVEIWVTSCPRQVKLFLSIAMINVWNVSATGFVWTDGQDRVNQAKISFAIWSHVSDLSEMMAIFRE